MEARTQLVSPWSWSLMLKAGPCAGHAVTKVGVLCGISARLPEILSSIWTRIGEVFPQTPSPCPLRPGMLNVFSKFEVMAKVLQTGQSGNKLVSVLEAKTGLQELGYLVCQGQGFL